MATDQIVQSLSYITWALLGALSLGSMAMVWLLAQATDAARGFLVFSALMAGVIGILWFSTETSLPPPSQLAISAADELADARRLAIGAAAILAIVAGIRLRGGSTARWWGLGAIGAGVIAMAVAAWGWTDGTSMAVPYLVQLVALSAVTGGSLAALVLSHWYLVAGGDTAPQPAREANPSITEKAVHDLRKPTRRRPPGGNARHRTGARPAGRCSAAGNSEGGQRDPDHR